ncbi:MAG: twin-arginine translocation signal domain-containing protein, partial [Chloroflexi bacterium]|nr:twin-arginine translocation signal domain-containing protein [Chloroflexota bacterium]
MSEKKLSRRDFLKAASTALAASGFAALPVGVVRAQDEEVTLVLWGFASNRVEWMQNVVDELWSDMHPNVGFTFEQTPYWDLWPKLTAAF